MTYLLSNTWEQAGERLRLLEECHDPGTTRRIGQLGLRPGARCLDVGAGAGSIARRLAGIGPVTAVDVDPGMLATTPGVDVRRTDVVNDPLPGGFDLVFTRLLLMHLPERDTVLDKLVAAAAPGGVVLVEDFDFRAMSATATGAFGQALPSILDAQRSRGAVTDLGRDLPALLDERGLLDVRAEADLPLVRGGSPMARFMSLSVAQLTPVAVSRGADPAVLGAARADLDDPARWFHGPTMVAAWGRRPERS
jgi:SAM-dependent methyltransferase